MKQSILRMTIFVIVLSMLITTVSICAYAESGENDAMAEESFEHLSQDISNSIDEFDVKVLDSEGNNDAQLVQLRADAFARTHSIEQVIQNDYTLEMNIEHDAILVEYSYSNGIKMLSESFFAETTDANFDVPVAFTYDTAIDTNVADVYNVREDILNIKVTVFNDECIVAEISKQIYIFLTQYGCFTSDIDPVISKREYLSYLGENGFVDQATYDDLDRLLHCENDLNEGNCELSTTEYAKRPPQYVVSTINAETITQIESVECAFDEMSSSSPTERSSPQPNFAEVEYDIVVNADTVTVSGTVVWYGHDYYQHTAPYVKIEVMDDQIIGHRILATTTTNSSGIFSVTFVDNTLLENGYDIYLKIYCGNDQIMVHDCGNIVTALKENVSFTNTPYYFTTSVESNVVTSRYDCYGYVNNGVVAKSFSIANALYYARTYEKTMNGGQPLNNNPVKAHYPLTIPNVSFSLPLLQAGSIFLVEGDYKQWGNILHEYAHVVQNKLGVFSELEGAELLITPHSFFHSCDYKLTDYYQGAKEKALYMAWFEGWATYYSVCVQRQYLLYLQTKHFPGTSEGGIEGIDIYTDERWGEDHEIAIAAILTKTVYDRHLFTPTKIWNLTKNEKPKNYYELHELLVYELANGYTINENNISALNGYLELLEEEGFSASDLSMSYNSYSPTFSWKMPAYTYSSYNNVNFSYNYHLKIVGIGNSYEFVKYTNDTTLYTPSADDWNEITSSCPNGFYWYVRASEERTPWNSSYLSKGYYVSVNRKDVTHDYYWDQYSEWQVGLEAGEHYDFHIRFTVDGYHLIQTFGTLDTIMELYAADGTLLVTQSDVDDDGYLYNALVSYNFQESTEYILRLKARGTNTMMSHTKLAIVTTYPHDTYESAYGPYGVNTVGWSLGATRVALFGYKFNQSGTVTFTMSSDDDIDTFLFIIDPASYALIEEYTGTNTTCDNLYDDDSGGNGQAQIKKYVVANKEYLAIIAFYDPDETGQFSISSSFS